MVNYLFGDMKDIVIYVFIDADFFLHIGLCSRDAGIGENK